MSANSVPAASNNALTAAHNINDATNPDSHSHPNDEPAIFIHNLTFTHDPANPALEPSLQNVNLALPKGSRTRLIGANGAGKSTLLQLLAGKRLLPKESTVHIHGRDVFTRTSASLALSLSLKQIINIL